MSTRRRATGTALGALLCAGVVGLTAASLYLRARNDDERVLSEAPARAYARLLAARAAASESPVQVQRVVGKIKGEGLRVERAVVVVEPRSTKYRFLRKRRYLAHSDPNRVRQVLDRRHAGDKAIYDRANRVRRKGLLVETRAPKDGPFEVLAAAPVRRDGRHVAMALVITRPLAPPPGVPAWPLLLGVALVVLLGLLAGALTRHRYLVVMAGVVGLALFAWSHLGDLEAFYRAKLAWHAAGGELEVPPALASPVALPALPTWPLFGATLLAIGLAALGQLRLGQRAASALTRNRAAYGYVLPAAVGMLLLVFVPFGYGLGLGFFNHAHGTYTFVGLDNFAEILSGGGRPLSHPLNFYFTLGVTILWTGLNVFLHVVIGLSLAMVLKDPLLRFKGIYRVLLILPWAVPNYITALIWRGMFHHQYGAVNHVLSSFGIEKVSWFSDFSTAFAANVVTNTWLGFPFMMVVSLGALQSIPGDVYEAAEVDGASRWQAFWHITMPLLKPALFPAIILGTIWTFNQFNIIYLVSGGAPGGSTDILITEAYRWAFERADRYGLAAAYALIILVFLLAYTLITNRLTRATEDTYG